MVTRRLCHPWSAAVYVPRMLRLAVKRQILGGAGLAWLGRGIPDASTSTLADSPFNPFPKAYSHTHTHRKTEKQIAGSAPVPRIALSKPLCACASLCTYHHLFHTLRADGSIVFMIKQMISYLQSRLLFSGTIWVLDSCDSIKLSIKLKLIKEVLSLDVRMLT